MTGTKYGFRELKIIKSRKYQVVSSKVPKKRGKQKMKTRYEI